MTDGLSLQGLHDLLEGSGLIHGQISQDLTINLDLSTFKGGNKFAVRHIMFTDGSIDTRGPEGTEVAFPVFTVTIRPDFGLHGGVFGVTEKLATVSTEASGGIYDAFAAFT
jgi:hypothetical protein